VLAAVVPPGVVTSTDAVTALPAGVIAVIVVSLLTFTDVAAKPPTETAVAPVKPVPVMVISVLPKSGPLDGDTLPIVGIGAYL
jgi:peptidoglycan/LPS O-acetylase OafA/YrhL